MMLHPIAYISDIPPFSLETVQHYFEYVVGLLIFIHIYFSLVKKQLIPVWYHCNLAG